MFRDVDSESKFSALAILAAVWWRKLPTRCRVKACMWGHGTIGGDMKGREPRPGARLSNMNTIRLQNGALYLKSSFS